jgi:hypothetical protein
LVENCEVEEQKWEAEGKEKFLVGGRELNFFRADTSHTSKISGQNFQLQASLKSGSQQPEARYHAKNPNPDSPRCDLDSTAS